MTGLTKLEVGSSVKKPTLITSELIQNPLLISVIALSQRSLTALNFSYADSPSDVSLTDFVVRSKSLLPHEN